jgi:oxygen-dependent protoporphyrinogen oxidase
VSVLVLGGGISGLAAAYELGRAGVPTLLLEASDRLGGKVATEVVDGLVIDHGPDSFVSYRPAAVELCRELGLGGELIAPREPRVVHVRAGGRFARLPDGMGLVLPTRLRPFVTTDLFTPAHKLRAAMDLVLPRVLTRGGDGAAGDGAAGDVAVGAFLERRLGRALVDRLAGPLIGGVYGTAIDELSLDAVVPQLREAERRHRSLLLASLADGRARRRSGRAPASPFVALRGGIGQLVDALVAALRSMPSVELRTGVAVEALMPSGTGLTASLHGGGSEHADGAVVATTAAAAAAILEAAVPAAAGHIRSIPHGSTAVVSLAYRSEQVPDGLTGHGFLVAAGEPLTIHAATLSSNKWADRAPSGWLLARAFIGDGPAAASARDEDLVAAATGDLAATLGLRGTPALTRVARYRHAMPNYTVGHLDRVAAAVAALAPTPQVVLAGGAYGGVGIPDCIRQGRTAANRITSLLGGGAVAGDHAA